MAGRKGDMDRKGCNMIVRLSVLMLAASASSGARAAAMTGRSAAALSSHSTVIAASQDYRLKPELASDRVQTTLLEIRLAETEPARGLVQATVANSDRQIYLHEELLVTNNDVLRARVVQNNGHFNVAVTFSEVGATAMARATATHVGKPIAIILDGSVIAAPIVRDAISADALLTGNFTQAEAARIASGLNR
jgi:preprotein translocase subunit SecD